MNNWLIGVCSRVVSFTELTDNDLELTIIAGINYVVKVQLKKNLN